MPRCLVLLALALCCSLTACTSWTMSQQPPAQHPVPDLAAARAAASAYAARIPGSTVWHYLPLTGGLSRTLPREGYLVIEPVPFAAVSPGSLIAIQPDDHTVPQVRWLLGRSLGALLTYGDHPGPADSFPSYGRTAPRPHHDPRAAGRTYPRNYLGAVRHAWIPGRP